jgi:poly(A) polymerase
MTETRHGNDGNNEQGAAFSPEVPVLALLHPPWRDDTTLARLMAGLGEGNARIVGGAVRNAVIGLPVRDVDIATRLTPREVAWRAQAAGFSVHPVGIEHGSVIVARDGRAFEVTTLRRDVETDGRHARVVFTTDWAEDARRRDFTMNALYADLSGQVFDPVGGLPDTVARRVRFIGNAAARIREDYLRILRFFRFWAAYDTGPPDAVALTAIRENAAGLEIISRERIREELRRLLIAPRATEAVAWMRATGVAARVFPHTCDGHSHALAAMAENDRELDLEPDWLLRLVAFCGPREDLREAFRLSREERERLRRLRTVQPPAPDDETALKALLFHEGEQGALDIVRVHVAWGRLPLRTLARLRELIARWKPPAFPLHGRDILAAGVAPGPLVGELLRRLKESWIAEGFPARDNEAWMKRIRREAQTLRDESLNHGRKASGPDGDSSG